MKTIKHVSLVTALTLAAALLAGGAAWGQYPSQNPRTPPQYPPSSQPSTMPQTQTPDNQTPNMKHEEVKTFSGKISMSNGKYVLEDSTSNTSYVLDNQKKAKQFEGKNVTVTGTLDSSKNRIHVKKIEAV